MNKRTDLIMYRGIIMFLFLLIFQIGYGQTLACNDNVQISLAPENIGGVDVCGIVGRDNLLELESDPIVSANPHVLEINGSIANELTSGGVTYFDVNWVQHIGETIEYKVIDAVTSNSCWGTATIEANVFNAPELPCLYTEAIHKVIDAKIEAGDACVTVDLTALGIVFEDCQTPSFEVQGDGKYPCDAGPDGIEGDDLDTPDVNEGLDDGWCQVQCIIGDLLPDNTIEICLDGSIPLPTDDIVCEIKITANDCTTCETWCPDESSLNLSIAEMEAFLANSCFAEITQVFKDSTEFGDACSGMTKVVSWSGTVNRHGEDVSVDLGTQGFKISPLHLYIDETATGSGKVVSLYTPPNPDAIPPTTGSGILILPDLTVSLNCTDDPGDLTKTGQPLIVNHHNTVSNESFNCIDVHYIEVVDIVENSPALVNGKWILVTKVVKENKFEKLCSPEAADDFFEDRFKPGSKAIGDIIEILNLPDPWPITLTSGPEILTFDEIGDYACNTLLASFTNDTIPGCGAGYKIFRSWTLVDWCTTDILKHDQLIDITDTKAPTIDKTPVDVTISIEPWICTAEISSDNPGFVDECNDPIISIEVTDPSTGVPIDPAGGLPAGVWNVSFTASDVCGNISKPFIVKYNIIDQVKPVAVCEDELLVSLTDDPVTGDAIAKVYAESFDSGSHDGGCGPIAGLEIIRMDHRDGSDACDPFTEEITTVSTDKFGVETETTETVNAFGPFVKFCCGEEGTHTVVLKVYDAAGNTNECMVQVTVDNKLAASLTCVDEEIVCIDYTGDPTDFGGVSTGGAECAPSDITELDPIVNVNSCGIGTIIRTFTLENGAICRSTITVSGDGAFDPNTIRWPLHAVDDIITIEVKDPNDEGECVVIGTDNYETFNLSCGDSEPSCEPYWESDACGLIGVSYTDEEPIEFDDDACFKIIRRWTVVDWCTWEPNDGANNENLDDENDTDRDTFVACGDWCTTNACQYYYRYENVDVDGYYTFDQIIKVVDENAPVVEECTIEASGIGEDCTGSVTFSVSADDGDNCPSQELAYSWELKNSAGDIVESGVGSTGIVDGLTSDTYLVHFTVTDGCGNSGESTCSVELKDGKAPTPFCLALATAVMNNGEVEIWASDFIQKGEDNCTPEDELIASFSGTEAVANRLLTCDDVTGDEVEIMIYLWDADGNADFCVQTVTVVSNGHCDDADGEDDDNTGDGDDDDDDDDNTDDGDDDDDGNTGGNDGCSDELAGGVLLTDPTDLNELTICAGDGISDAFDTKVWENFGASSFLVTDEDLNILAVPTSSTFDFEGQGEGVCLIWHVSSEGELTGVEVGANAADIGGCFDLSNPITVTRVTSGEACEAAGGNAFIAGNISTENGVGVADVEVMANNSIMPEYPVRDMSSSLSGNYAFMSNPMDYDYAVSATRNDDYTNGVSTLDLVVIQKHILGLQALDSPYKVIAADINSDQRVTASDLVQLRQLILGNTDKFINNDSWRFVDASQTFANTLNPWPFTEVIDINNLQSSMIENFVGVKIGDVTNNAKANELVTTEVRSNGNLTLSVIDSEVQQSELVSIDVSAENFSEVYGFQFTMQHAGLELVDIAAGTLEVSEANVGVREGMLTMSWNNSDGVSASDVLFTLNFKATSDVTLSNAIAINSRITPAEAYLGNSLSHNDVNLVFNTGETTVAATGYDLYQNEPNPFTANTNISFVLPKSDQATISIYDVTGKVVRVFKEQYNKGLNTISLSRGELGAVSGILYYQLSSGEFTATKKMIIIE